MNNLELPHSKLFYFISLMYKRDQINEYEKLSLKELVIVEKIDIFQYLETFQQNNNEEQFVESLVSLVRQKDIMELYKFHLCQDLCYNSDYEFPGRSEKEIKVKVTPPNESD